MRKLLMVVTMLLVPALANAWVLAVKVTNTSAGIAAGNKAIVTVGTATTISNVTAGTSYFYPANNIMPTLPETVTVEVVNPANATVTLGGSIVHPDVIGGNIYTMAANPGRTLQTLGVVYGTAPAAVKQDIVLKSGTDGLNGLGGVSAIKIGAAVSAAGFTAVTPGTVYDVVAQPNVGYKVTSIVGSNVVTPGNPSVNGVTLYTGSSSSKVTISGVTVPNEATQITVIYAVNPQATLVLAAPPSAVSGTEIHAVAQASSNVDGITYEFATTCAASGTQAGNLFYFTPDGTSPCTVSAQVKNGSTVLDTKSVTITVANGTTAANQSCTGCHTGSTPTIVASYNSSLHAESGGSPCESCHTTNAHTTQYVISDACAACHSSIRSEFRATAHWNNHLEYGPEFTGGAVEGEANANESWTTYENGKLMTCSIRCHFKPNLGPDPNAKDTNTFGLRPGKDECLACHEPHKLAANYQTTCMTCHQGSKHGKVPSEFWASKHWQNHLESGPEFASQLNSTLVTGTGYTGGTVTKDGSITDGILNANDSYQTTENGGVVTCAYRCHFRPGMYPTNVTPPATYVANRHATTYVSYTDTLNNKTYTRPGGDACNACHDAHNLEASYQTCLTCHTAQKTAAANIALKASGHGLVPFEFFNSKHWKSSFEYGEEFANQMEATAEGANVKLGSAVDGVLNANDSYTTTENGSTVTCAYRCHFRPGMGPEANVSVTNSSGVTTQYLSNRKATTYVMYSSPYGAGKFYRPGGNACMACHDAHGLEASARSTCYTCHAGGNHGWSVKAFEKSTHFTGTYAIADGMGGPTGKACTACHNAHSTEASFGAYSSLTLVAATGCQTCHIPGDYGIYNADQTGKAPHFSTTNTTAYVGPRSTCADCHGHNNTVNAGWAEGGHGSVNTPAFDGSPAENFKTMGVAGDYQADPSLRNCVRCHTAKGFAQFVDSGFTNVNAVGDASDNTSEPLVCSGCHNSVEKGTLRLANYTSQHNGGGYTARYGYKNALANNQLVNTAIYLGNMKNSNICMPCHSQRASGQEIKDVFAVGAFQQYSAGSAIYPHAAQPAAIVAGKGAYEFTPFTAPADGHFKVGLDNFNGTGTTQGPCVGCHMNSLKTHSLEITPDTFIKNCAKCHGSDFDQAAVDVAKAAFEAEVAAIGSMLVTKGITLDGINPLPERKAFDMSLGSKDNAVAEKNMGAWFNWYLLKTSDPAAYVHNPSYTSKIIQDTKDYLSQ